MAILKIPVTSKDHIQGNGNALITLVEYGDYQCPYCGKAYPIIKQVQDHFGKDLRFVFRNFPLAEIHPLAEPAAECAEFAGEQDLFWQMHDLIYENQESLSIPLLFELADTLELSSDDLANAIENQIYQKKIHIDFIGGVRSGVNGTPSFFINDHRYNGPFQLEQIIEAIDAARRVTH